MKPLALLALSLLAFGSFGVMARAQTNSDETQLISLTMSIAAKSASPGVSVHVTNLALTSTQALARWTAGERTGEETFQKRAGVGWVPLGRGGGQLTTGWLVDYGIPAATATALIAGVKHCSNPQHVVVHGKVTFVCRIGPCSVC